MSDKINVIIHFLLLTKFSDDPWNQTAADNPEWLLRFRSDIGIAYSESTPWDLEGEGLFLPCK